MKKIVPYLISLLFTLFSLGIHMATFSDSMLNDNNNRVSNGYLTYMVNYHKELPAFSRRPLTTILIETTSQLSGLSIGMSYIWMNYTLFFFSGVLLFWLAFKLTKEYWYSIFAMAAYFLTFSVLFAFFSPIYTYDEPLQYCLILLAFLALLNQRWLAYILCFTLATISRETSVLLLPAMVLFFPVGSNSSRLFWSKENLRKWLLIVTPLFLYLIFLGIFLSQKDLLKGAETEVGDRFSCFLENFENQKNAVESIISIFLSLGTFLYLLWVFLKNGSPSILEKKLINAFLLTFVLNTVVVLLLSFARESRLFALPLFFLWPLAGSLFLREIKIVFSLKLYYSCFKNWQYLFCLLLSIFINYLVSFKIYESFYDASGKTHLFNEYLFVTSLFISVHFLLSHFLNKNPEHQKSVLQWAVSDKN